MIRRSIVVVALAAAALHDRAVAEPAAPSPPVAASAPAAEACEPILMVGPPEPSEVETDPEHRWEVTAEALNLLFEVIARRVPKTSSCYFSNADPPTGQTVGRFLAERLSVFSYGRNSLIGECHGARCEVRINHMYGEDLSDGVIRFRRANGHAVFESLDCDYSP